MERTIRVTGKGRLSVRPDTTRLILIMEGIQATYDTALEQSAAGQGVQHLVLHSADIFQ